MQIEYLLMQSLGKMQDGNIPWKISALNTKKFTKMSLVILIYDLLEILAVVLRHYGTLLNTIRGVFFFFNLKLVQSFVLLLFCQFIIIFLLVRETLKKKKVCLVYEIIRIECGWVKEIREKLKCNNHQRNIFFN